MAEAGDRVFMLRVGRGKIGIVASGYLSTDPYEGEDWLGTNNPRHYSDIIFDVKIFPLGNKILETKTLEKEIPSINWRGGHSGLVISDEEAAKLESLWYSFLKENYPIRNTHNHTLKWRKAFLPTHGG